MLYQACVIFFKEFGGYFRSRLAYFLIGAYAFISMFAAFYMGAFFDLNNMELYSFFYFQGDVFALLVPALTMRLWAEERRSGTMELLLTQPVSYTAVVLGKFLSAWAFCLLLLLATVPFLLCPAAIYPLDYLNILSSYLACFFIAGIFCPVGCCVSAFNKSPVIAYIATLILSLIISTGNFDFLISEFGFSGNVMIRMVQSLNFSKHFQDLSGGQIGLDNIVYYLSMIILPLWLNVITVEYKKS